jgi:SAM-dependent methyltransferase
VKAHAVLEVGCGTGAFAHLLSDRTTITYAGFDFSAVAIERAQRRTGTPNMFYVADALNSASYKHEYDTIVCTEVLEHIENDLGAIDNWRRGANCVCSVPNFDAPDHVRFFRNEREVHARYQKSIEINRIVRVRKPVLSNISWASYGRALRWYRYRPLQFLAVLGVGSFDSLGGWFLFSGQKR